MAITSATCSRPCPPERPHKQIINGRCYCTDAVPGGGVERISARYPTAPIGPTSYRTADYQTPGGLHPSDFGVGMNGCPSCGMEGLGTLDSTLSMVVNLAVIGLAAYGAYHLFIK